MWQRVAAGSRSIAAGYAVRPGQPGLSGPATRGAPATDLAADVVTEEFTIPAEDAGISLYVRNKHPAALREAKGDRVLLFVHGATYPAETSFDLRLGGISWMEFIAARGYDVYLVDVRGYGRSTRPPEMDEPPDRHPPIVRTETAVADVRAAIRFIQARRGVGPIDLMGWSWGTSTMGWFTARNPGAVHKLVLYAPQWLRAGSSLTDPGGALGAYRTVSRANARSRWLAGVPEDRRADLIPAGWFEAWANATFSTDPAGAPLDPPTLRAPNGIVQDTREHWAAGRPLYDPADIRVPTLLVHAEWDADLPSALMHAYFARLVNAPYRRAVEIGEGTHTVIMEKNRLQLFHAVQQFLDEEIVPER